MLEYAQRAAAYTEGRTLSDLEGDDMLANALARVLEIVGEAAAQINRDFRDAHPGIPWARVIGMRNRLIHGYPDIDLEILWSTAVEDIPPLIKQLRCVLTESSSGEET